MKKISINDMLKAGVHFGHQTSRWNPRIKPYIFGSRDRVHIIDIRKTKEKLEEALAFVSGVVKKGGKVLLVGTKKQAKEIVRKAAESCSMPYVVERWLGGTLTNFNVIKKQIDKLADLEEKEKSEEFDKYTKKEKIVFRQETDRLRRNVGGLRGLDKLPECIFVIDVVDNSLVVKEARSVGVPIVALVDTNADPEKVDYPIPSNDDAIKAIEMMSEAVAETIKENYKKVEAKEARTSKTKSKA
jgi:small subunit ribosomal protein S2